MSNPAAFSVQHDASSLSSPPSEELKASSIDPAVIKTIETRLDELDPELRKLSLDIHSHPELAWEEVYAHEQMSSFMEKHGFTVSRKHAGLKTAWRADFMYGSGGRVLGINSEMDALPGIGHACGHNLIGICGIGIAVAVKAAMLKHNLSGKIILLGTPAEENGGGKLNLIDNGDYKEMDVCIMYDEFFYITAESLLTRILQRAHPGAGEVGSVSDGTLNALQHITVHFNGQGAHAAGAPWDANNALDAAVLAYSSISLLRQQIKPECRIQGIMEGNHWTANVIPDNARLPYIVRAANKSELEDLSSRVQECFRAAAIATGCEVTISLKTPHLDVVQNTALGKK
ncbi:hypothetical protein H0H81_005678 [Sphagnurus paluster]|uniref:Peptidase M20 dimerisation domain-containing protein n=1 Tax=Sphagnurus paluster TaxID=117069 RepID=A0A9P7FY05_9AGAR|nr:hypothetical protein H0H81_005678 [Sphagnurus paluster]